MGILNTMDKEIISARALLRGMDISLLDAARLVRNILDALPKNSSIAPIEFCAKVIEVGKRNIRSKEMRFNEGFFLYLQTKGNLRPDSLKDIRYLGKRLLKSNPELSECDFSEFSVSECEKWLSQTFSSPRQFNKARTMLHGLFEFALRREWCDKNPIKLIHVDIDGTGLWVKYDTIKLKKGVPFVKNFDETLKGYWIRFEACSKANKITTTLLYE